MSERERESKAQSKFEVQPINDLEKRIVEAFEVFDHGGDKTVDVREVGTILRSLGCCPSEAEVQELIVRVEDQETSGSVHLAHFLPVVTQIITEYKLQPATPEELLAAFKTLDKDNKGYLERDFISKAMMEEGEPFTQEEVDEMMAVAINPETGNIPYEYYINQIMVNVKPNIYSLIPPAEVKEVKRKIGEGLL
ncbi:dynein regulatory complex protein 8 [Lycorma delicatula]|uniref:dynein regulatory complex protein 8 n=1 Tax=Lycorma delicatula TaxID=130591 RepID=UPI003F50FB1E